MPSPFPGMNPYFERPGEWVEFHTRFLIQLQNHISSKLPPRYFVKIDEGLSVDFDRGDDPNPRHRLEGGVAVEPAVVEPAAPNRGKSVFARLPEFVRPPRQRLTVREWKTKKVVAVIELLSPTTKAPGKDRAAYLDRREALFSSDAHLVEIDLLRGGEPMPFEDGPESEYRIAVSRVMQRPTVEIWPFGLRDPIPAVPLPLKDGDAEVPLDFKAVLDAVYDGGRSELSIYTDPPEPSLSRADAAWANKLLR